MEQSFGQPQAYGLVLALQLELHELAGKIVFAEVGGIDEALGFLIALERRDCLCKRGKTPGDRGGAARARVFAGILREAQVSYRGDDFAAVSRRRSGS
jgi:hypothetical protein